MAASARSAIGGAAQLRADVAAWDVAEAERERREAEAADAAAARGDVVHRRKVHLHAYAPRLLRRRPVVEAFSYDGQPLAPRYLVGREGERDEAAVEQHRREKRLKSDGTTALPPRAVAAPPQRLPAVVNAAEARSVPHPNGGLENGAPQHVLHENLMALVARHGGRTLPGPRSSGGDVQITEICRGGKEPPLAHVLYIREDSPEWTGGAAVGAAIDATCDRALDRPSGSDNTGSRSDTSGGTYVNHGITVLWQRHKTAVLRAGSRSVERLVNACEAVLRAAAQRLCSLVRRRGTAAAEAAEASAAEADAEADVAAGEAAECAYERKRKRNMEECATFLRSLGVTPPDLASASRYRKRFGAPYRHVNGRDEGVQRMCELDAKVCGAAARVLRRHLPEVYEALWAPVRAAPVIAPITVYPTPAQQQPGGCVREWDVRDAVLPDEQQAAAMPLGHLASRTSGLDDDERPGLRAKVARGVSNFHIDRVDSKRRHGVPIVYCPRISRRRRLLGGYNPHHPMPSSDLVLCENGCTESEGGGRTVRIVTCVEGWVCIVLAHYECCAHGGVYPNAPDGSVVDGTGAPHLEGQLVSGVELLRLVLYQMARVDDFSFAVQAEYEARGDGSDGESAAQRELLREVYWALEAPLDERFRMLHPWLEVKDDDEYSEPFGPRGRWQQ